VVLCRRSEGRLPDLRPGGDDAGIRVHGWTLVADVVEGRIFHRDGKSAVLVREPAWNDAVGENVVERCARLSGMGWVPVVDWIGLPRDPEELSDRLAACAVAPDPRMRRIMEGHALGPHPD
jgi:hypothetical protein